MLQLMQLTPLDGATKVGRALCRSLVCAAACFGLSPAAHAEAGETESMPVFITVKPGDSAF